MLRSERIDDRKLIKTKMRGNSFNNSDFILSVNAGVAVASFLDDQRVLACTTIYPRTICITALNHPFPQYLA
jgi:hypothetical protein